MYELKKTGEVGLCYFVSFLCYCKTRFFFRLTNTLRLIGHIVQSEERLLLILVINQLNAQNLVL